MIRFTDEDTALKPLFHWDFVTEDRLLFSSEDVWSNSCHLVSVLY